MTTREHAAIISPKTLTVDGLPLTVTEDVNIETGVGINILHVGIICKDLQLSGDTHQLNEETPIYDQLKKEFDRQ